MPVLPPTAPVLGTQLVHQILLTCLCDPKHFKFGDHARIATLAFTTLRPSAPRVDVALFKSHPGLALASSLRSRSTDLMAHLERLHESLQGGPLSLPASVCHPLDYASRIGSVKLLEFSFQRLPMNCHGVEPGYSATVACERGYMDVLRWWGAKSLPNLQTVTGPLEFTVPAVALSLAIKNGHLSVIQWWHKWTRTHKIKRAMPFYSMIRLASDIQQLPILGWIVEQVLPQLSFKDLSAINLAVRDACSLGRLPVLDFFARLASPSLTGGLQPTSFLAFPLDLRAFDAALQQDQYKVLDWFVARGLPMVFSTKRWGKKSQTDPSFARWSEDDAKLPAKAAHHVSGVAATYGDVLRPALVLEPRHPSSTIHIRLVSQGLHEFASGGSGQQPRYQSSFKVAEDAGWLQPCDVDALHVPESVTPAELFRVLEVKHMLAASEAELETIHARIASQSVGAARAPNARNLRPVAEAVDLNFAWEVKGGPFVAPAKYVFGGGYKLKYAGREPVTNDIPDDTLVQFTAKVSLPAIALMPSFSSTLRDQLIHTQFGDELLAYLKNEYQGFQVATPHVKAHVWERVFSIQQAVKKEPGVKLEAATWDMEPASHAIAAAAEALDG